MFDARFAPFLDMAVLVRAAAGRFREKTRQAREMAKELERRQALIEDLGTKKQRTARELRELCAAYRQAWAPGAGDEAADHGPAERVDSSPAPGAQPHVCWAPGIFLLPLARAGSFVDRSGRQFILEACDE